ncbi:MAG: SCO family protein [Paracoccaceae bacterium]
MRLWLAAILTVLALPAAAHNGVVHQSSEEASEHKAETAAAVGKPTPSLPFPVDIRAEFKLVNQDGQEVTQADFAGKPMAIFFGYANCEAICSVALPRLGAALDLLGSDVDALSALLITVDPKRDTADKIGPALAKWHPRLRGLTGSEEALAAARDAFQVQSEKVFDDPEGNPIYSHGSFIYLIGGDGKVLTLLPPILGPERMAEIIKGYL